MRRRQWGAAHVGCKRYAHECTSSGEVVVFFRHLTWLHSLGASIGSRFANKLFVRFARTARHNTCSFCELLSLTMQFTARALQIFSCGAEHANQILDTAHKSYFNDGT
jgi:hypothetical protein